MGSFKFKIIVLGNEKKSNLLKKYLDSCFNQDYKNVIGCNIFIKTENLDYDDLTFSIWDISSNERFQYFRTSFYHGACICMIFLDLTNHDEFENIPNWIQETNSIIGNIPIFIIGYQFDCNNIVISDEELHNLCSEYQCFYHEINADTINLDGLFNQMSLLSLDEIGYSKEKREQLNKEYLRQIKEFQKILNEFGFKIINKQNVEILTSNGLFTVNILNGKVYYEHFICEKCDILEDCKERVKNYNVKKSLCIIRKENSGWANIDINFDQLLILSKIFSIMDNKLPVHVMNQMSSSIHCEYGKKIFKDIIRYQNRKLKIESQDNQQNIVENSNEDIDIIRSKLRNLELQFWDGSIPPKVYFQLREKYERILNS